MGRKGKTSGKEVEERDSWDISAEYLLSLLGYAVGPGNILRFPYLTLRNGGGAFLIPYFLCLFISGIPLVLLETYMGQSTRRSCITCWDKFVPFFKGAGFAMAFISLLFCLLYQSCLAWILYYMAASLTWTLPWISCNQTWNTPNCVSSITGNRTEYGDYGNYSNHSSYSIEDDVFMMNYTGKPMGAAEEYWQYNVLRLSSGIEEIGLPNWKLCIAHVVGQVIVFLCVFKGVRSVGKIVWVTATAPYVLLIIFLVRAALLPGSMDGIRYYVTFDAAALANPETWVLGFLQIFYTLGVGWGALHTMASYNKRSHNFIKEAISVPIATCLTSFASGFVVFSCAGFLAQNNGIAVDQAISAGPGLAFVSYPELATHLPAGPLWSFLFFLMLLMVTLDSIFVTIETCCSSIADEFRLSKKHQTLVLIIISIFNTVCGIVFFTNGGMYLYQLVDWYYSALLLFLVTAMELIALMWIYGFDRVADDVDDMIKWSSARLYIRAFVPLWGIILPIFVIIAMFWSLSKLSKPIYGDYIYPEWCASFGWTIAAVTIFPVFIYMAVQLVCVLRKDNSKQRLIDLFRPNLIPSEGKPEEFTLENGKCEV